MSFNNNHCKCFILTGFQQFHPLNYYRQGVYPQFQSEMIEFQLKQVKKGRFINIITRYQHILMNRMHRIIRGSPHFTCPVSEQVTHAQANRSHIRKLACSVLPALAFSSTIKMNIQIFRFVNPFYIISFKSKELQHNVSSSVSRGRSVEHSEASFRHINAVSIKATYSSAWLTLPECSAGWRNAALIKKTALLTSGVPKVLFKISVTGENSYYSTRSHQLCR